MKKPYLLIDTDPGVDDALAILMAHAKAEVVGLTIAAGNVGLTHTTANALKLLDIMGKKTPVFPGCPESLVYKAEDAAFVHGKDGFGDTAYFPPTRSVEAEHAALAILRLSHQYDGQLVLIALAPLTNLALALKLDPSLPSRISRLIVMGGAVTGSGNTHLVPTEFNIGFDPEAAHIVFSTWKHFELVDWEATMAHGIDFSRFQNWLDGDHPSARFYRAISRKTVEFSRSRGRDKMLLADALAMAIALDPDVVLRSEERHASVELNGSLTRGATVVDWNRRSGKIPNARIVLAIDQERFENLLAQSLGN